MLAVPLAAAALSVKFGALRGATLVAPYARGDAPELAFGEAIVVARAASSADCSSARMTIQSSSPRTIADSRFGAVCLCAAARTSVSAERARRVEGFGGSTSRMIRRPSG